jgi:hypothetical protein
MYYRLAETYLLSSKHHNLGNDTKALLYLNKVRKGVYRQSTGAVGTMILLHGV